MERRLYPNKLARMYLAAIEDVMGRNGVAAILRLAKLGDLVGNYPPDNFDCEFSFQDFSAVNQAIQEMYGPHGARGLCLRAGRTTLRRAITDGGLMADLPGPAFRLLPVWARVKVGLATLAETLARLSDQVSHVEEDGEKLAFVVEECPECWARSSDGPICFGNTGMLQEAVHWLSEGEEFSVIETECMARGDYACTFVISRELAEHAAEDLDAFQPANDPARG